MGLASLVKSPKKFSEHIRPTLGDEMHWRYESAMFRVRFFWNRWLYFINLPNVTCLVVLVVAVMIAMNQGSWSHSLPSESSLARVEEQLLHTRDLESQIASFHAEHEHYKRIVEDKLKLIAEKVEEKLSVIDEQISTMQEEFSEDIRDIQKCTTSVVEQDRQLNSTFDSLTNLSKEIANLKSSVLNQMGQSNIDQLVTDREDNRVINLGTRNFASRRSGAVVLETLSSPQYFEDWKRRFYSYIWSSPTHQWPIVDRKIMHPGDAFCFEGSKGVLSIKLSDTVPIALVRYEHDYWTHEAPPSCLKEYDVHVCLDDDCISRELIANCRYDEKMRRPYQFCHVKRSAPAAKIIQLEFLSNYGQNYTCVYNFQVFADSD